MLNHILLLIAEQSMTRRAVVDLCVAILRGVGVKVTTGEWWNHGDGGKLLYLQEVEE